MPRPDSDSVDRDRECRREHTRLAIVALVGGAPAMLDRADDLVISFNRDVFDNVEVRDRLPSLVVRVRTRSDSRS